VSVAKALVTMTADNSFTLYVNGQAALSGVNWSQTYQTDISSLLLAGTNNYTPGGSIPTGLSLSSPTGVTEGYTLGLTRMGKLPIMGMSQGVGQGAFTPAAGSAINQAPDLWAVRSDSQVQQGGVTFVHAKEGWVSTPSP